jgi:hypothetical protein
MRALTALALCTLIVLASPARAETAAEAYRKYVDRMIPLSFDLAKENAVFSEQLIFFDRLSNLQSGYSAASDAATLFDRLLPLFPAAAAQQSCPSRPDSSVDVAEAMRELMLVAEVGNARMEVAGRLAAANLVMDSIAHACDRGLEDYSIDRLRVQLAHESIDPVDGAYFAVDLSGNPYVLIVSFFFTMFQIIENDEEQQEIGRQQARYIRDSAKSADYARFARNACRALVPEFTTIFESYRPIRTSLEAVLAKVPEVMIAQGEARLSACVESEHQAAVARLMEQVSRSVHDAVRAQSPGAHVGMSIELNMAVQRDLVRLASVPCGTGAEVVDEIRGAVSAMHLYGLSGDTTVAPRAEAALEARARQCGGRHL